MNLNPHNREIDTHVVAICILNTLEDMGVDFPDEGGLLIRKNVFDSLNGEVGHQIVEKTSLGMKWFTF